jgi:hypothetical protein
MRGVPGEEEAWRRSPAEGAAGRLCDALRVDGNDEDPAYVARLGRTCGVHDGGRADGHGQAAHGLVRYSVVVSIAGYGRRGAAGGRLVLHVFRFAGAAFAGSPLAELIWWKRSWGFTLRSMIDGSTRASPSPSAATLVGTPVHCRLPIADW